MQQVKIFYGLENETGSIEKEINDWIRESGVKVLQITGNVAPQSGGSASSGYLTKSPSNPSDVMIIVLYETTA